MQQRGNISLLYLPQDVSNFTGQFKAWVHDNLPSINKDLQVGKLELYEVIPIFQLWITQATRLLLDHHLNLWQARMLLMPLGLLMSSLEKYFQESGHTPGSAISGLE